MATASAHAHADEPTPQALVYGVLAVVAAFLLAVFEPLLSVAVGLLGIGLMVAGLPPRTVPCPGCKARVSARAHECPACAAPLG